MRAPAFIMGGGLDIVRNGLTVWLDAQRADSYSSGQTWTDLMGLSNMYLGTTSGSDATDPTFNTGAPNYWSTDAGDYFTSVNANAGTLVRTMGRSDTAFTIEVWGYMTSSSTAGDVIAGNTSVAPGNNGGVRSDIATADRLSYYNGSDNTYHLTFAQGLSAWKLWTWTVKPDNSTACTAYENAVSKATGVINSTWNSGDSNGNFTIWASSGGLIRALSNWRLGALRLYNRILTASEIMQNFQVERGKYGV